MPSNPKLASEPPKEVHGTALGVGVVRRWELPNKDTPMKKTFLHDPWVIAIAVTVATIIGLILWQWPDKVDLPDESSHFVYQQHHYIAFSFPLTRQAGIVHDPECPAH